MKKRRMEEVRKVEEALIRFHRSRVDADSQPGEFWQQRVMSRILEENAPANVHPGNGGKLGSLIWRFAFVTSIVAVFFAAYAVDTELNTQYELAESALMESAALDLATSFVAL